MNLKFNKKFLSFLVAGVISISPISLNKTNAQTKNYIVANTKVNIRDDSNTDGNKIGLLDTGDKLEVIKYLDNGWYEVIYNGKIAYVCGDYVTLCYDYSDEELTGDVIIAKTNVNVREENNTYSNVLGTLSVGDSLDYLEKTDDGWYKVLYNGSFAYVNSDYVDLGSRNISMENVLVVIANKKVNIRIEPNTDCKKIGMLEIGDTLRINKKLDNGWYEVIYNNQTAYVCGDFVSEATSSIAKNKIYKSVTVLDDEVIYSNPELTNPIGLIPKYEIASVYRGYNNYYQITSIFGDGYIRKAKTKDLGDPFVVVDISDQEVSLYKENNPFYRTPAVTGKNSTPTSIGLWKISSKRKDYYMSKYDVHVDYWMHFHDGQGLHDASWRKKFGGNIYKKSGSHGCVNVPYDAAKTLYENVEVGTKVLVKK